MPELRMAQNGPFGQLAHGHGVMSRRKMQLRRPANKSISAADQTIDSQAP